MTRGQGKIIAQNRKASHDYFIENTIEAGSTLRGTEIKSVPARRVNLKDSHAIVDRMDVKLLNMHNAPNEQANWFNHDATRTRKLLLHRKEIDRLAGAVQRDGYTLDQLKVYIKNGYAKILLGLAKGKK